MNYPKQLTRALTIAALIFANFIFLNAQTEIPAGTKIPVQMDNGINSESAGIGDTFTAVTTEPLILDGVPVLSAGASIIGRVVEVESASGGSKSGSIKVEFEKLRFPDGNERAISAVLVNELKGKRTGVFSALAIIGGAAAGGIIGLITGTKNGAAIGAGVGAGAGTGVALSRKGKNVGIGSNQIFEIELTKAVKLPADGY